MQQFEYLVLKIWGDQWQDSIGRTGKTLRQKFTNDDSALGPLLNALGMEGWDLVCNATTALSNQRLIFKRPKSI